jgi:hypothetical protein
MWDFVKSLWLTNDLLLLDPRQDVYLLPDCARFTKRIHFHVKSPVLARVVWPGALPEALTSPSAKSLPRVQRKEPPGMPLTGKRPSPSAKNRTLGEDFPECRPSTRGRFDAVGAVHSFLALGEEFCFFFLKKILFPECLS